ncbi:MAG: hypothetical protein CM15mP49_12150 [Actinomycetota bacterium]|nr:MAG: hypothetical protein CM15mP49_12150 [Actinomycetota bacterium]
MTTLIPLSRNLKFLYPNLVQGFHQYAHKKSYADYNNLPLRSKYGYFNYAQL